MSTQTAVLPETTDYQEVGPTMYDTIQLDGRTINAKANQIVEFVVDDGKADTEDESRIRVISRAGKAGDPRVFERLPTGSTSKLEQYVIIPAQQVLLNGKPMHGDRYSAVAYCERLRKLIFLHDATDNWATRIITSWAVYRSDGPSAHRDVEVHAIGVVQPESSDAVAAN